MAVPIFAPLEFLSVKTAVQDPDFEHQSALKVLPEPEIVAMPSLEHVLSLKLKVPPFGPFVVTFSSGLESDRLIEQGFTDTP